MYLVTSGEDSSNEHGVVDSAIIQNFGGSTALAPSVAEKEFLFAVAIEDGSSSGRVRYLLAWT